MIAGPCLIDEKALKLKAKKSHKNSLVGPAYNSDSEELKNHDHQRMHEKAKEELNREAKQWKK